MKTARSGSNTGRPPALTTHLCLIVLPFAAGLCLLAEQRNPDVAAHLSSGGDGSIDVRLTVLVSFGHGNLVLCIGAYAAG